MGASFGHVFLVAAILVAVCFVPALFLRRTVADKTADPANALIA